MLEMLKVHEGLRLESYRCPTGYWTIGYGTNLEAGHLSAAQLRAMDAGQMTIHITEQLADEMLHAELASLVRALLLRPEYMHCNEARRGVLLNMSYNLGFSGLLAFKKMTAALRRKDYATAALEMLDSRWARTQCVSRANTLSRIMSRGTDS